MFHYQGFDCLLTPGLYQVVAIGFKLLQLRLTVHSLFQAVSASCRWLQYFLCAVPPREFPCY